VIRARMLSGLLVAALLGGGAGGAQAAKIRHRSGLFAQLRGTHERSGGSPGRGSFAAVIHDPATLCYGITLEGTGKPSGAQLHKGTAHRNGPTVLALTAPTSGSPGASSGCVTASAALLSAVRAHPAGFYMEVTTANGNVRGQLFQPIGGQDQ
jgi:hypothetical protein